MTSHRIPGLEYNAMKLKVIKGNYRSTVLKTREGQRKWESGHRPGRIRAEISVKVTDCVNFNLKSAKMYNKDRKKNRS